MFTKHDPQGDARIKCSQHEGWTNINKKAGSRDSWKVRCINNLSPIGENFLSSSDCCVSLNSEGGASRRCGPGTCRRANPGKFGNLYTMWMCTRVWKSRGFHTGVLTVRADHQAPEVLLFPRPQPPVLGYRHIRAFYMGSGNLKFNLYLVL